MNRVFENIREARSLEEDEAVMRDARAKLPDDAAFDGAWRAGRLLTLEQAIAEAASEN